VVAFVDRLPAELRPVARRIPGETVALMEQAELELRAGYVADLLARAESEEPRKALRTRKLAERVIHSTSDYTFSRDHAELSSALADASRRADSNGAYEAFLELKALEKDNPRVPVQWVLSHQVAPALARLADEPEKFRLPPLPGGNLFSRNRRNKRK